MAQPQGVTNLINVLSKGIDRLLHAARNRKKNGRIGRFFSRVGKEMRR